MYGATLIRFWPLTHSACASEMIQCRKGARIGVCEFGASGSAMIRVYFVVAGSVRVVRRSMLTNMLNLPKSGSAVKLKTDGMIVSTKQSALPRENTIHRLLTQGGKHGSKLDSLVDIGNIQHSSRLEVRD